MKMVLTKGCKPGEKADGTPAPNIEKMEAKIGRLTLVSGDM
jgi:hypothetical protein